MRFWLSKPWVDAAVLVVVIAYGVFVFFDLGVGALATEAWRETWSKVIDAIFLLLFVIELAAKVLAFGPSYVTDSALNMIDASAIVVCAVLFLLSDITNVILATGADDDEAAEDSEKIAALLLLLRCIRVVRLAAVMVRSLNVTSTSITRAQTSHNGSMKNPLKAQRAATGYRGSTGAETWEIRRREACERPDADELGVPKETQRFLCDTASEDVVRLLTGEFQTLLTLFKKLDTSGDGSLQREEMIPGLRGLGLSEEVSEKFFAAMDVDNTGGVEVAELFRAGAYLRADGLEMRKRLNLLANSRKKPSTPTRTAPDGGAAPALKRRSKLKRLFRGLVPKKCTRLREKLLLSIRWWARERWDPSHELKATLMFLKPIKMAQARQKSLIQLAPPYLFKPGRIEVREHLNGSGAMLETRIEHLLFLLEVTLADVGEMSRKLQEIEIGQPKDALQERHEIAIYRTFLEGLCRALPAARLRIEPFANVVHYHTWHALCPGEGAERRVTVGSKRISIAFCTILGLRIVHLLMVNVPWTGESAYDRRLLCEQRFAVGTPTAELNFVLPKDYVPTTLSCDASDALFAMQGTAVIAPLLSLLMLPLARTLFRQNSNPTALQHLIKEPRVMLLLLQAIIWAGVNAVNMTRFPVILRVYSVDRVGTALFLAALLDCIFIPLCLFVFLLMDCLVVPAPRTRCVLAITLLLLLLESMTEYYMSDLPSAIERKGLAGTMINSLEMAMVAMVLGAVSTSFISPRALTFIKLPTTLMELVLFEEGAKELKKRQDADALRFFLAAQQEEKWMSRRGLKGGQSGSSDAGSAISRSSASSDDGDRLSPTLNIFM